MRRIWLIQCKFSKFTIFHILVPLVETLPFCTFADPRSSIDVAWIYMVGKRPASSHKLTRLLFGLYGG